MQCNKNWLCHNRIKYDIETIFHKHMHLKLSSPNGDHFLRASCVNSLRPSDGFMRQWTVPLLVQIMACRLFGDNPISKPMMVQCQLDNKEHISKKFYLKFKTFHSRKCIWKHLLQKWRRSCLGLNVLNKLSVAHIWVTFFWTHRLLHSPSSSTGGSSTVSGVWDIPSDWLALSFLWLVNNRRCWVMGLWIPQKSPHQWLEVISDFHLFS